jgi:DNA-binding GntR family transcriptional regulator
MLVTKINIKETAREYALRVIRNNIISLELAPGTPVSENELAKELGISRTPVREALLELSKVHLVEVYPQRGCVISLIDWNIVEEAVFMRRVLEKAVIENLCEVITEEDIMELEQNVQLQEFYLNNSMQQKIFELDNEFHFKLYSMCNKERIFHIMEGFMAHFDRVRTLSLVTVKEIKIVNDHRMIINTIKERNKEQVDAVIEKHLSRYKLDYSEMIEKYPDFFQK